MTSAPPATPTGALLPEDYEANSRRLRRWLRGRLSRRAGFPAVTYLYKAPTTSTAPSLKALQSMEDVLNVDVTLNNQGLERVSCPPAARVTTTSAATAGSADYNDPVSFLDMFIDRATATTTLTTPNPEYDKITTEVLSDSDAAGRMEPMHPD